VEIEAGRIDRGAEVFDRYLPLIAFEGQVQIGLGIRKEILVRRGVLRSSATRALASLDDRTVEELDHLLDRLQIRPSLERMEVS
jgi:4-hydroxy-tetrahydrodipicolinate synthase